MLFIQKSRLEVARNGKSSDASGRAVGRKPGTYPDDQMKLRFSRPLF